MNNKEDAEKLSYIMKNLGHLSGIETRCILTNMDQPIGKMIGNSLEIEEAKKALNGEIEEDVKEVVLEISSQILKLSGKGEDIEENKQIVMKNIINR